MDPFGQRRRVVWPNVITLCVLLPVGSIWAIVRIASGSVPAAVWVLTAVLYVLTMFGVTLGNHRYWTHRGFKVRLPLQIVLAVASALSLQGDIEQWVLTHRAHHRYSDVIGYDPHSPLEYDGWKGALWAQGIWLLYERPPGLELQPHRDLTEDKVVQAQRKAFPYLAFGQFFALGALYPWVGLDAVLIAGALRASVLLVFTNAVNSVCHLWGNRAVDSAGHRVRNDGSRNNVWVALISAGEGNHSWHHADPSCPRHGRTVRRDIPLRGLRRLRPPHPDLTWRLIQVLTACGAVYDIRAPRTNVYFAPSQRRSARSAA